MSAIRMDQEGKINSKRAMFGFQGKLDYNVTQECYPFVLFSNGWIDFGSGYNGDADERRALTDILDNPIKVGSLFRWESIKYGIHLYKVTEVHSAD